MAISKTGSRLITVDGQKYRWSVRRTDDDTGWNDYGMQTTLTVAVEHWENPQGKLTVHFECGVGRHDESGAPVYAVETGEMIKISPRQAAELIHEALECGWKPETKTGFSLKRASLII